MKIKLSLSFRRALTKTGCLYEIKGGYMNKDIAGLSSKNYSGLIWFLCVNERTRSGPSFVPDELTLICHIW